MITSPLSPTERNPYNLAYAPRDESLSLTIDGRQLIPFNSVNTDSKKLAFLTDFFGPVTMPGVEAAYNGIKAYSDKSNGDTELWGLTNPNTGVRMNGVMSYGAIKVGQFINNDMTIVYNATLDGAVGQYATLVLLAEVVRVYTKSTGIVANLQLPPSVNNM